MGLNKKEKGTYSGQKKKSSFLKNKKLNFWKSLGKEQMIFPHVRSILLLKFY